MRANAGIEPRGDRGRRPAREQHADTLTEEKTTGEIAAERPGFVRVFDKYGIDYCCGGKISLTGACTGHGIPPEQLLQKLDAALVPAAGTTRDWQTASLNELNHHLTKHHAWLKTELPRLRACCTR